MIPTNLNFVMEKRSFEGKEGGRGRPGFGGGGLNLRVKFRLNVRDLNLI